MLALRTTWTAARHEKRFGGLVTSWDDYLQLYRAVTDELAIGEASACYLWSETCSGQHRRPHPRCADHHQSAQPD